jgi:ferredoxin
MLSVPEFRAERCVRYRYTYSECSRCADVCPHQAIKLGGRQTTIASNDVIADSYDGVEVLTELCKGCGLCSSACPTEALKVNTISAEHLLKQAGEARQMTISCAPSSVKGDAVVPCLGALNPMVLAEFAKRGIALQLAGTAHCTECQHAAKGPQLISVNLAAYQLLFDAAEKIEPKQWIRLDMQTAAAEPAVVAKHDTSRRDLFRRIVSHSADVMSSKLEQAPPPLRAIRAAAPFLPERKILLNGLYAAAGEEAIRVPRHIALPAEDWKVDKGCTYCEACVRACPTGALQLLESNTGWRLAVLNDRCVACDVCAEVCQPKVLRPSNADEVMVNKQKGRLLVAVEKTRCPRCDRVFVNEQGAEICPICSGDDDDFAEIFG